LFLQTALHSTASLPVAYFRAGDHVCLFYRSPEELLATLIPYIRVGLERNERCFCAQPAEVRAQLMVGLETQGIQVDSALKRGALVLVDPEQIYFEEGQFDPQVMTELLRSSIQGAVQDGFSGFRAAGEMHWSLSERPGCDRLVEYEALMDTFYPRKPAIGLCAYPASAFTPEKLQKILEAHRLALLEDYPKPTHRTVRIRNGSFYGDIAFDGIKGSMFHCLIQRNSGGEILSWTHEQSLGDAITSVERQLRCLGQSV